MYELISIRPEILQILKANFSLNIMLKEHEVLCLARRLLCAKSYVNEEKFE